MKPSPLASSLTEAKSGIAVSPALVAPADPPRY
jgi:hypothetical protein